MWQFVYRCMQLDWMFETRNMSPKLLASVWSSVAAFRTWSSTMQLVTLSLPQRGSHRMPGKPSLISCSTVLQMLHWSLAKDSLKQSKVLIHANISLYFHLLACLVLRSILVNVVHLSYCSYNGFWGGVLLLKCLFYNNYYIWYSLCRVEAMH